MATTTEVPGRLPVAINGHAYLADPVARETVPVMRTQADTSTEAGEQSLNPQGLWRRSQESWHHGAGQDFLDGRMGETPPDPRRFRSSKGVDIWTKGQASLLHPTLKVWSTANTNLQLAVAQETAGIFMLYVADGNELYWNGLPFNALNTQALRNGTGWTATNATIASSSGGFTLTATAGAAVTATSPAGTGGVPVDPGRAYGFALMSDYLAGGAGRIPRINVNWYDVAGALISSSTPVAAAGVDTAPVTVITSATAPSTAAYASLTLSWATNWTLAESREILVASIGPYDVVSTFGAPDVWLPSGIQAGEAAQPVQSITSDGGYVWAALGISGLHRTFAAGGVSTANVPAAPGAGQISMVAYCAPFLLAAGSTTSVTGRNTLWLVNDPLGVPALSVIKTHANGNFKWEGAALGRNCVYTWGNNGGNGEIYKVLFDPNTGTLSTAASPATSWPDGETIHSMYFYAGGMVLGTGRGLRLGTADGAGNIDYGPLIETDWPVRCLEPQDRYCWFGYTKYDATNSGLGRVDLGFFTDTLTPAWASDLMTADTSTGDTVSCVTFAPYGYTANQRPPVRVFTVAGKGVYIEDPGSHVASGTLDTGTVRFSTSEPKTTRSLDVRHHALPAGGSVAAALQRDVSGTWTSIGSSSTTASYGPATPLSLQNLEAEAMEFRFTLARPTPAGVDYSLNTDMTRWTAKVLPTPTTVDEAFTIPIIMRSEVQTNTGDGVPYHIDVPAEVAYLKGLEQSRDIIDIQIGSETIPNCYVAGSRFEPDTWKNSRKHQEGVYTLQVFTARG